ncbi:MAG: UDP-sulfoquinovose synthase [Candidatus Hodarchaeota archaeon]
MRVLIAGMDGYLGWPLAMHLTMRGHQVYGVDNISRRRRVAEVGSWSATPIRSISERLVAFQHETKKTIGFTYGDLRDIEFTYHVIKDFKPEAIVHLGEIPSAPYSMIDLQHCNETMMNNIIGTNNIIFAIHEHVPDCHLIKLGTMGEYGTPNVDIPEGFFNIEYRGRKDRLPFPRQAGSWYHQTKVHDTNNIIFACKIWGLRSTDIMQGVVYGTQTDEITREELLTRFDFDEAFGTALNRFCAQAVIGQELTPYGKGGQTRGYIALIDSIQCQTIAIENPPEKGEYRTLNQFDETYSVNTLAKAVVKAAGELGIDAKIWNIENPRIEAEEHYYNPDHDTLYSLGFKPTRQLNEELTLTIQELNKWRTRIEAKKESIIPKIYWNQQK